MAQMKLIEAELPENNKKFIQSILELTDQFIFDLSEEESEGSPV